MQFHDDELQEFCEIWKREFRQELSLAEARERATELLELYALLARPLPSEWKSQQLPDQSRSP